MTLSDGPLDRVGCHAITPGCVFGKGIFCHDFEPDITTKSPIFVTSSMIRPSRPIFFALFSSFPVLALAAPDWKAVEPILAAKCYSCHGGEDIKGEVDMKALAADPKLDEQFELWHRVLETIESGEMPPRKAKPLEESEETAITAWVTRELDTLAQTNSGDPGPVTMRRLTNPEYDRSIRDLTGRDYRLAKEFQTDGGGGEGFSNTGDVLFLSPAALDKYFNAARQLADHATVMPGTGIVFHEHRIGLRGPEQLKAHAEQGLYVWYQQKAAPHLPADLEDMREGDYLLACWKHQHLKTPLDVLAKEAGLKLPFLQNWWNLVTKPEPKSRFLDLVRVPWRELPGPDAAKPKEVPAAVTSRIAQIEADLLSWNNRQKPGTGVQRRQQDSDGIRPYPMDAQVKGKGEVHLCFGDLGDGNAGDIALVTKIDVKLEKGGVNYFNWLEKTIGELKKQVAANPAPANLDELKKRLASLETTRALFGKHPKPERKIGPEVLAVAAPKVITLPLPPGAISLRADTKLDYENPEVDQATIQWTATTGTPRDVTKIIPGVLTIWKIQTEAARRTMGEFGVMKVAFPDMFERRLEEVARNLHRGSPGYTVYYFSDEQLGQILGEKDKATLVAMKKDWRLGAPKQLNDPQKGEFDGAMIWHLHQFASRAWRRPLAEPEKQTLAAFYQERIKQGLDRESAVREGMVRVLVSPHFIFKAETLPAPATLTNAPAATTGGDLPLSSWELASRLSYFLWSSIPDWELRKAAEDGSLRKPEVLAAQAKRMLKDPRARALAEEFAGQWLKFSSFEEHDGVDTMKYPEMIPELRADMKREVVEFFGRLFREDRRVMDIVTGETSFLNERLAKFYGIPNVTGPEFREVKVADHHRGGLLGMGAILTKTSRPNRTSPVLRGEFLYAVVLGHSSPPPPPNVPELEKSLKPASLREALLKHREDQACAVCHDRIDPLGFALESFDPIGRFRAADEAGGVIDDTGELRDGTRFKGMDGLRDYLAKNNAQFTNHFSRKLLGYALGRSVLPSDKELLSEITKAIGSNDGKVSAAVIKVVTSRQFMNRRNEVPALAVNP